MINIPGGRTSESEQKKALKNWLCVSAAALSLIAAFYWFPLDETNVYPKCPWYFLTKTWCPGCGSMRGINGMIHGRPFTLLGSNLAAALALPFLSWSYIQLMFKSLFRYRLRSVFLTRNEILILGGLLVLWGIIRNIFPVFAPG